MKSNGEIMKEIEIEDDLYKYILANIEDFGETPSQILRRLLALPEVAVKDDKKSSTKDIVVVEPVVPQVALPDDKKISQIVVDNPVPSIPESVAHGVSKLLQSQDFQSESIITKKFKMMLTAMYHENRAAFIVAADTTKGRTRDYLGQNLTTLLASENKKEVAQLKASKPHDIPYTPFWVITNANTGRKCIILTQIMRSMGYSLGLIEHVQDEFSKEKNELV